MKKLILLLILTLPFIFVTGQEGHEVTGRVTDLEGLGIPGVSIQIQGTRQGGITDLEGNYQINVPSNGVLEYSFIGYATQQVEVAGQTKLNIQLAETPFDMDEVVVIGYGTAAVKDVTGTIAVVRADEITSQPVINVGQALQGKVALRCRSRMEPQDK